MTDFVPHAASKGHVLIVDDNLDDIRLLVEALRAAAYRTSIAFDGLQAGTRAPALRPDLIMLDLDVPRMGGLAVTRMLKADPATAQTPIILFSVRNDPAVRIRALREGAADFVAKPFSPGEVVERVRIHLCLAYGQTPSGMPAPEPPTPDARGEQILVRAVKNYVYGHLSEPLRLASLARTFAVSERRLSRAFRNIMGITVFEFIRNERLRRAQRLLTQTSLNMLEIAEETGFSSAANFSTAFRKHVGASPSQFRRRAGLDAVTSMEGTLQWQSGAG